MEVALCVVRANPTVLEGLGAHLEGDVLLLCLFLFLLYCHILSYVPSLIILKKNHVICTF